MTRALTSAAALLAVSAQFEHGPAFALACLGVLALSVLCGALAFAVERSLLGWGVVSGDRVESAILRENGRKSSQHDPVTAAEREHVRAERKWGTDA